MKVLYAFLVGVMLLMGANIEAQYTSTSGGNYEDDIWSTNPPDDGDLTACIYISDGHEIVRSDDGSGDDIIADGSTNYTGTQYSGCVFGTFTIEGDLDVTGDRFYIADGGTVIVYGDVYASEELYIATGGTLIVYGDLITDGLNGGKIHYFYGDIIVAGDVYVESVYLSAAANLVVGGDLYYDADFNLDGDVYVLDDDASVGGTGYFDEDDDVGDSDDLEEDNDYDELEDWLEEVGLISSVDEPTSFTYDNLSGTSADLSWELNSTSDDVIIALYSADSNGSPEDGTTYAVGDVLSDGAEIIFVGSSQETSTTYASFSEEDSNYLRIWSVDDTGAYSVAVELVVKTLSTSDILYEDFEDGSDDWTLGFSTTNNDDTEWNVGTADAYMGSYSAYTTEDGGSTASYDEVNASGSSTVDLTYSVTIADTYKSAELSFYWKGTGEADYDGGSVVVDGSYAIDSKSLYGQDTWVEEVVDLTDEIGSTFDIDFRWEYDEQNGDDPGFCIDEVRVTVSEVARPESFTATASSYEEVYLSWEKSADDDDVIIAYSESGTLGRPESGVDYEVGDYFDGGGKVIYVGSDTEYTHSGTFEGELTYSIWSESSSTYSSALTAEVQIPVSLPFYEDFEDDTDNWVFDNSSLDDEWIVGSATSYDGSSYSAYISTDKGISADYDALATVYLELEVDLSDYESATLTFWYKCDGTNNQAYGSIYVDDADTGNDYYNADSWTQATVDLSNYTDDIVTLQFRWEDVNKDGDPGFCIDNVYITGTIDDPSGFTATNDETTNELTWTQNTYDYADSVMVVWNSEDTFGTPEEGVIYEAGDEIDGGGTVLYYGYEEEYTHDPLNYSTTYYYMAYSARGGIYSTGVSTDATTESKDVEFFSEDWEGSSGNTWDDGSSGTNAWVTEGTDTYADGVASAYISDDGSTADYDEGSESEAYLITSAIDLSDATLESATLSFDWKCEGGFYTTGRGPSSTTTYDYGEVYVSTDNNTYTRISQEYEYYDNDTWESTSIDLSTYLGSSVYIKFYWHNTGDTDARDAGIGFCVDNIEVTGSVEAQSLLDNENTPTASISSLANTSSDAVSVLEFDLTDQSSAYDDATRVKELVISQGSLNIIDDWSDAIGGAYLYGPDISTDGLEGTISSASITFTDEDEDGLDDGFISVEDATETYYLMVWLNTDLNDNDIEDGDAFDFAVSSDDMVTGEGDDFTAGQLAKSYEVTIDVEATDLSFTLQPSAYGTVDYALSQVPEVSGVDANGNVDLDFAGAISLSNCSSLGMSPTSATASDGVATFTDLTFTESGTVTLDASYSDWTTVTSDEVVIDSYCIPSHSTSPTCYINNVIINGLSNTTGDDDGYGDYLDESVDLTIGVEYDIDLGLYTETYTGYAYVWIDWDESGTFDDDERFDIGSVSTKGSIESLSSTITVPDDDGDAVSGSTRMRVQFIQNSDPSDACQSDAGESEDYTLVIATNGWLGSTNQWAVAQNWASGEVPDYATDIYIPEHPYYDDIFPVISEDASMNDLEIAENATLTISAGVQVDIYGDVITNGGLIIYNTEDDPATIIIDGTVTGNANVQWPLTEMVWWYIGHSVSGVSEDDYDNSFGEEDYALNIYDGAWERIAGIDDIYTGDYPFSSPLEGYSLVLRNSDQTLSYNGVLNSDDSYSDTFDSGLRLVANPYPSYVDVLDASGYFIVSDFNQTVYIRRSDNLVSAYNLLVGDDSSSNEGSRYIAPGQCMWIRATSDGATVTIGKDACTHSDDGYGLKSSTVTSDEVLRMQIQSDYNADELVIIFNENGSNFYTEYDSEKVLNSGTNVSVYSIKDGTDFVVNSLPELATDDVVELGYYVATSGMSDFTLTATNIDDFMPEVDVYLTDNDNDSIINLRNVSSYTYTPSTTEDNDRFELTFEAAVSTDIESDEVIVSDQNVLIYTSAQTATVKVTDDVLSANEKIIELYNILGELLGQYELISTETEIELPQLNTMYIIRVNVDNAAYQEKVIGLN